MYALSNANCQLSAEVRIDKIEHGTLRDSSGDYGTRVGEMRVYITIKLGRTRKEHTLQLLVVEENADINTVSGEFVWRPVELGAYCRGDHANPYSQGSDILIKSIWFGDAVAMVLRGSTLRD